MKRNVSGVTQGFYDSFGNLQQIPAGFCVDETVYPQVNGIEGFAPFVSLRKFLQEFPNSRVFIMRNHALGDIYMLFVLLNTIKKYYKYAHFTIVTGEDYARPFALSENPQFAIGAPTDFDVGINLNGVLERDHLGGEASNKHRVRLYAEALGMEGILNC